MRAIRYKFQVALNLLISITIYSCSKDNHNAANNNIDSTSKDSSFSTNYYYSQGAKIYFEIQDNEVALFTDSLIESNENFFSPYVSSDITTLKRHKSKSNLKKLLERDSVTSNYEGFNQKTEEEILNFYDQGILILPKEELKQETNLYTKQNEHLLNESTAGIVIKLNPTGERIVLTGRLLANFKDTVTEQSKIKILRKLGLQLEQKYGFIELRPNNPKADLVSLANRLFESGLVEFAHPDFYAPVEQRSAQNAFIPNDALFYQQWNLKNIGQSKGAVGADAKLTEAWAITRGSPNVIIAIIDDAIDVKHEDLRSNYLKGYDASNNDNDPNPSDPSEIHGTAVAGIAVARGNNSIGISGSCPECKFIAIRVGKHPTVGNYANAFNYAVANGAWIISNSWGFSLRIAGDALIKAINNAATNGRSRLGCLVFFAMSNKAVDNCTIGLSADISSLENVIAVSGSNNFDKTSGNGYGKCMELVAPTDGGSLKITTTDVTGAKGYSNLSNYYSGFTGNSAATPLVAGVAGLILSINPRLTRAEVAHIFINSTDKIDPSNALYNSLGFSQKYGYGRINARKSINNTTIP